MKGSPFILLNFAFLLAVHATKGDITDPIYHGLNAVLIEAEQQNTNHDVGFYKKALNETLNSITESIDNLKGNNVILEKLESLKSEGDRVQACIKDNEANLTQFIKKLGDAFDICSNDLKKDLNYVLEKLNKNVIILENTFKNISEVRKECLEDDGKKAAASILCVVTRLAEVQGNAILAKKSIERFINEGVGDFKEFVSRECNSITPLKQEFEAFAEDVRNCANAKKQ